MNIHYLTKCETRFRDEHAHPGMQQCGDARVSSLGCSFMLHWWHLSIVLRKLNMADCLVGLGIIWNNEH